MPLFIVATPIGNLSDLTERAKTTLVDADLILAEDTRHSKRLLNHIGSTAQCWSYHDHNADRQVPVVIERLTAGDHVALISDAGTPAVSDPGYRLVAAAHAEGIPVVPIPGASALTAFISASGLPTDQILFAGFAPRGNKAAEAVTEWMALGVTIVLYESPKRVVALLETIAEIAPTAKVAVGRELTKKFEEFVVGPSVSVAADFASRESVRGEFVVGFRGQAPVVSATERTKWVDELAALDAPTRQLSAILSRQLGMSRSDAYGALLAARRRMEETE